MNKKQKNDRFEKGLESLQSFKENMLIVKSLSRGKDRHARPAAPKNWRQDPQRNYSFDKRVGRDPCDPDDLIHLKFNSLSGSQGS